MEPQNASPVGPAGFLLVWVGDRLHSSSFSRVLSFLIDSPSFLLIALFAVLNSHNPCTEGQQAFWYSSHGHPLDALGSYLVEYDGSGALESKYGPWLKATNASLFNS
jgi:hypothetical protein